MTDIPKLTHLGLVLDNASGEYVSPGLVFGRQEDALAWASGEKNHLREDSLTDVTRIVVRLNVIDPSSILMVAKPIPATHEFVPFTSQVPAGEPKPVEETGDQRLSRYLRRVRDLIAQGRAGEAFAALEEIGQDSMAMRNRVEGLLSYTDRHAITEHQDKNRVGLERVEKDTSVETMEF